jgi:hypothetical protein
MAACGTQSNAIRATNKNVIPTIGIRRHRRELHVETPANRPNAEAMPVTRSEHASLIGAPRSMDRDTRQPVAGT